MFNNWLFLRVCNNYRHVLRISYFTVFSLRKYRTFRHLFTLSSVHPERIVWPKRDKHLGIFQPCFGSDSNQWIDRKDGWSWSKGRQELLVLMRITSADSCRGCKGASPCQCRKFFMIHCRSFFGEIHSRRGYKNHESFRGGCVQKWPVLRRPASFEKFIELSRGTPIDVEKDPDVSELKGIRKSSKCTFMQSEDPIRVTVSL